MSLELKKFVEDLYKSYAPLAQSDLQLIGRNKEDNFRKLSLEKCQKLSPDDAKRVEDELFGWGPLAKIIHNKTVFDILIQGPHHIFFEDSSGLHRHNDCFLSQSSFRNFSEFLMDKANIVVNQRDPFGNGQIESFRVHIVRPPISEKITITLRKQRQQALCRQSLLKNHFLNESQNEIIEEILEERKNFLVVGPTGSGKTTFLNSLIADIPPDQRLIVIEDTDEIQVTNPLCSKLLSREICPESLKTVDMGQLVKQSLRMRPDRLVIGEVRGPEAKDLLQALATGHSGSMGTLHAQSAQQALLRLEMLVQMGAPQWSLHSIRQLIQLSLSYLIVLREDRQRKGIKEIKKITSHESFGLLVEDADLFRSKGIQSKS